MKKMLVRIAALVVSAFSATLGADASAFPIDTSKLVDLTYAFDASTVYWPTEKPFHHQFETFGISGKGYFYSSATYEAPEHGGTHMDAPIHFNRHGMYADEVPLANLVGPAAVIDFSARAEKDPDATLSVHDIEAYETAYGRIPDGAVVLGRSGWGRFWPDKRRYLGTDKPGDVGHLRFPGFSPEAVRWLLANRNVVAIAIDTASMDSGASRDFQVHQIWLGANRPGFENVANANKLPPKGAIMFCIPMKIGRGTGGPARIFALLP